MGEELSVYPVGGPVMNRPPRGADEPQRERTEKMDPLHTMNRGVPFSKPRPEPLKHARQVERLQGEVDALNEKLLEMAWGIFVIFDHEESTQSACSFCRRENGEHDEGCVGVRAWHLVRG